MFSKTNINMSFLTSQFLIQGFATPVRRNRTTIGEVIAVIFPIFVLMQNVYQLKLTYLKQSIDIFIQSTQKHYFDSFDES